MEIGQFLKDNAGVKGVLRALSNICANELLFENVNGYKLLIIFEKNWVIDIVIKRVLSTPLSVYFYSLFILEII